MVEIGLVARQAIPRAGVVVCLSENRVSWLLGHKPGSLEGELYHQVEEVEIFIHPAQVEDFVFLWTRWASDRKNHVVGVGLDSVGV